jgi:pimeloyl-ACP methyl ester carboxylesterase
MPVRRALFVALALFGLSPLQAQTTLEDKFFDSNGIKIRYVEAGRGEAVLLFHAMSESLDNWREAGIIDGLANDFRVIAFDSRGHGKSDKPHAPTAYGLQTVEDAARLLDHLQVRSAHVVGYSMGGYVAGRFVASFPDRVLTATFGGSSVMSPSLWAARFENRITPISEALERGDPRLLLGRQAEGEELEHRVADLLSRNDPVALAAAVRSFKAMTLTTDEIEALAMPVLVVVGSEDLPESRREAFEGLKPDLDFVVIDGATHGPPRGALRGPEFLATVRSFFGQPRSALTRQAARPLPL